MAQDKDQQTKSKRLLAAMKPPKPLDQMTEQERRDFWDKLFDETQKNRQPKTGG